MPPKLDAAGHRFIQVETEVPGTPEEVWQAIATGPGVTSWFVPCEIEGQAGGTVTCHFGAVGDSVAKITDWQEGHSFRAEGSDLGPGSPTMATEWTVEAKAGGSCVVRVVHSLFTDKSDWDEHLIGVEHGWPGFFRILRLYLLNFQGKKPASFIVMNATPKSTDQTWQELSHSLGLDKLEAGQAWSSDGGAQPLSGRVESARYGEPYPEVYLTLQQPIDGIVAFTANPAGPNSIASMCTYFYGDLSKEQAAQSQAAWQDWMNQRFPPSEAGDIKAC